MKTVKEIEVLLKEQETPTKWIEELESDERIGVKRALKRWHANHKKRGLKRLAHIAKKDFDASYKPFPEALIAGVDEAGRGPLAGPVVTAAVILPDDCDELIGLDDSKAVSKEKREQFAEKIKEIAIAYAIHIQPANVIDDINIYEATRKSMEMAVKTLETRPDFVIADAMALSLQQRTASVVKADAQSLAVAAASMLAKTTRDDYMKQIHEDYPMYQFEKNAGYGTADHVKALETHGPCVHHRRTFEPVKSLINS